MIIIVFLIVHVLEKKWEVMGLKLKIKSEIHSGVEVCSLHKTVQVTL